MAHALSPRFNALPYVQGASLGLSLAAVLGLLLLPLSQALACLCLLAASLVQAVVASHAWRLGSRRVFRVLLGVALAVPLLTVPVFWSRTDMLDVWWAALLCAALVAGEPLLRKGLSGTCGR